MIKKIISSFEERIKNEGLMNVLLECVYYCLIPGTFYIYVYMFLIKQPCNMDVYKYIRDFILKPLYLFYLLVKLMNDKGWDIKKDILGIILCVFLAITAREGYEGMYFVVVLMLCAKNIKFDNIVKVFLLTSFLFILGLVVSSLCGIIPITADSLRETGEKSFGINWHGTFADHLFFETACYVWLRNNKITWKEIATLFAFNYLMFTQTTAKTSFLSTAIMFLLIIYYKVRTKKSSEKEFVQSKFITYLQTISPALVSVIVIILSLNYYSLPLLHRMDTLSARLALNNTAFQWYNPFSIFGQHVAETCTTELFFVVDCSYVRMLFGNGIIEFVMILYFMCKAINMQIEHKQWIRLSIFLAIVCYAVVQPRLIVDFYHPFILMLFADLGDNYRTTIIKKA